MPQTKKTCEKCWQSDYTTFSACRFCGTPYNPHAAAELANTGVIVGAACSICLTFLGVVILLFLFEKLMPQPTVSVDHVKENVGKIVKVRATALGNPLIKTCSGRGVAYVGVQEFKPELRGGKWVDVRGWGDRVPKAFYIGDQSNRILVRLGNLPPIIPGNMHWKDFSNCVDANTISAEVRELITPQLVAPLKRHCSGQAQVRVMWIEKGERVDVRGRIIDSDGQVAINLNRLTHDDESLNLPWLAGLIVAFVTTLVLLYLSAQRSVKIFLCLLVAMAAIAFGFRQCTMQGLDAEDPVGIEEPAAPQGAGWQLRLPEIFIRQ